MMTRKQINGTTKPIVIDEMSAMNPMSIGTIAPPTTHITNTDDARSQVVAHVADTQCKRLWGT